MGGSGSACLYGEHCWAVGSTPPFPRGLPPLLVPWTASFPSHPGPLPAPSFQPPSECAGLLRSYCQMGPELGADPGARGSRPVSFASATPSRPLPTCRGRASWRQDPPCPKQAPSCFSAGTLSTVPRSNPIISRLHFISLLPHHPSAHPAPLLLEGARRARELITWPLCPSALISSQVKPRHLHPTLMAPHDPAPSFLPP